VDLDELKRHLGHFADSLKGEDKKLLKARLQGLISVFPFNEYEYTLMFLCDRKLISFHDYEKLRGEYVSSNKYLDLYELAPRIFGEIWAQEHLRDIDERLLKANKSLDPAYAGEYDLWIENIKVEVKACRAINTKKRGSLVSKALRYGSNEPFWMNYQQIKVDACDAFVFIGVWVDQIIYWVLSKKQVKENKYLSHQHRGGIEYQIGITEKNIAEFERHRVKGTEIPEQIIRIVKT